MYEYNHLHFDNRCYNYHNIVYNDYFKLKSTKAQIIIMSINLSAIRLYMYLRNLLQFFTNTNSFIMFISIYLVWYVFNFKLSFTGFKRWPLLECAVSKKSIYNPES